MAYDAVEAELRRHPNVQDCVVTRITTGQRKDMLVAYVVTEGRVEPAQIRQFLAAPRLPSKRIPRAVIPVESLPRTSSGKIDRKNLPLPVLSGAAAGGKGGLRGGLSTSPDMLIAIVVVTFLVAALAYRLTSVFWPGSTDRTGIPQPWTSMFLGLYVAECLSFGLGVAFLMFGRGWLVKLGRSGGLTTLAQLSIFWLLASWWPQDNFYRLTSKTDWGHQAALVYSFNITMMIAAAILVVFALRRTD